MNPSQTAGTGASGGQRYRFGEVVVDAAAHTLVRADEPQAVEPKAFAVLLVLLRRADELVGHDELLDAVWGHRHVTPGVLTRAIAQLRQALGDDFHHPIYIQTQHALGYRFIGALLPEPVPEDARLPEAAIPAPLAAPVAATADADAHPVGDTHRQSGDPVPRGDRVSAAATEDAARPHPARFGSPQRWLLVAVLVVAVIATLLWYRRGSVHPRPADGSIAVLPFTSLSNDKGDSYFAEGLAVEMHDALAGVPGIKVAACRPDSACGKRGADVKALGTMLGVATVLDTSVRRVGPRVRINARLSDTRTGFTVWTGSYDRDSSDLFGLQSEIANEVVESLLGVLPRDNQALARRLTPTRNIVAYDAYLKGLQQLEAPGSDGARDGAVASFSQALAADPAFARAQAGICRAEIKRFESARDAPAFERAQTACKRASSMDPTLREVSLAMGELHRVRGESAEAIEQYMRALDDLALRPAAYIGLAQTQGAQGRNAIALDYFERALKLRPGDGVIHSQVGYYRYLAGDIDKAIESYRTASTLQPDDEGILSSLGGLYLVKGDAVHAGEAFERSLLIKPSDAAFSNLGSLKYEAGAYAEAADLYRHATEINPDDYRIWGNLGDALSALPATAAQAREPYRRAAQLAQRYVGIKTDDAHALSLLSWYRANLGEAEAARGLLARAEALGTEPGEVAFFGAQALALLGDAAGARERLARARAADVSTRRIAASPLLRGLLAPDQTQATTGA